MFSQLSHFLKAGSGASSRPRTSTLIDTARLTMRLPDSADWWEWQRVRKANQAYLVPWEPSWGDHALTHKFYAGYVTRSWRDWRLDKAYNFLIFPNGQDERHAPMGGISFSDVRRNVPDALGNVINRAVMGYWMAENVSGQGYMTEAVMGASAFMFERIDLNVLEATCLPHNEPSKKVLRKCGFFETGFAPRYMQINGKLEDHLLWKKARP